MRHKLLISVDEFTTPDPVVVEADVEFSKVLEIMESSNIRHVVVTKDAKPVGVISDRDSRFFVNYLNLGSYTARDIMTPKPYCVAAGTSLEDVVFQMSTQKIGSAIVIDVHGEVVGIFTATDALNALLEIIRGDYEEFEESPAVYDC